MFYPAHSVYKLIEHLQFIISSDVLNVNLMTPTLLISVMLRNILHVPRVLSGSYTYMSHVYCLGATRTCPTCTVWELHVHVPRVLSGSYTYMSHVYCLGATRTGLTLNMEYFQATHLPTHKVRKLKHMYCRIY